MGKYGVPDLQLTGLNLLSPHPDSGRALQAAGAKSAGGSSRAWRHQLEAAPEATMLESLYAIVAGAANVTGRVMRGEDLETALGAGSAASWSHPLTH